jgi:hypothetical protein
LFISEENQHLIPEENLEEWRSAVEEYRRKHSVRQKPMTFPMGTMAFYGPDDKTTTKIAAGVFTAENSKAINKRWVATDLTTGPKVQREIQEFFKEHGGQFGRDERWKHGLSARGGRGFPRLRRLSVLPLLEGEPGKQSVVLRSDPSGELASDVPHGSSVGKLERVWARPGTAGSHRTGRTGRGIAIPWNRHSGAASKICGDLSMRTKRIEIIPALHGKLTRDGKLSEPDIADILEKWLERHPPFKGRENELQVVRGRWTLREGIRTEVVSVSAIENEDIAGYDPAQDRDLYEYYLAEERYYQEF